MNNTNHSLANQIKVVEITFIVMAAMFGLIIGLISGVRGTSVLVEIQTFQGLSVAGFCVLWVSLDSRLNASKVASWLVCIIFFVPPVGLMIYFFKKYSTKAALRSVLKVIIYFLCYPTYVALINFFSKQMFSEM